MCKYGYAHTLAAVGVFVWVVLVPVCLVPFCRCRFVSPAAWRRFVIALLAVPFCQCPFVIDRPTRLPLIHSDQSALQGIAAFTDLLL